MTMNMNLNILNISLISLIFYLRHISITHSAACASLTTSTDCNNSPSCEWNAALSQQCYCTSNTPLDVVFVLDESGSVGSSNFVRQKEFISGMIREGLNAESNVHVITFGSSWRLHYAFWWDQSDKEAIATRVDDIPYPGGVTRMDIALGAVMDYAFYWWPQCQSQGNPSWCSQAYDSNYKRLLVFLTDGRPYPSEGDPCPHVQRLHGIVPDVIVVGIGSGWTVSSVQCMVTPNYPTNLYNYDANRIIDVPTWSDSAFANAKILTESFLCPEDVSLRLTEIRMEQYSNNGNVHQSRFVEFYNNGEELDLTKANLKFDGFMTSAQFGAGAVSTCTTVFEKEKYIVFYDPSVDAPECGGCACTQSGNSLQCDDAIYIPCDSTPATSGCGACTWDTNMNNDDWSQTVYDFAGNFQLSTATRTPGDTAWTFTAYTGYSHELKEVTTNSHTPGHWQPSCNYTGTPGQEPLPIPCSIECIPDVCRSQTDSNADCATGQYDVCDCTEGDKFYYSNNGYCAKLLPPLSCSVDNLKQSGYISIISLSQWVVTDRNYETGVYFKLYVDGAATKVNGISFYGDELKVTSTVEVVAAFDDPVSGTVESVATPCPIATVDPTPMPTAEPTNSNADIDTCNGVVNDYNEIVLTWSKGYPKDTTDILAPYTYYIYGEIISGDSQTAFERSTTLQTVTIDLDDIRPKLTGLDIATNGNPEIYIVTEFNLHGTDRCCDYDKMKGANGGKVLCAITTSDPTTSPTKDPTSDPTADPTRDPTTDPTQRPTYAEPTLTSCHIDIPGIYEIADGQPIFVTYAVNIPNDAAPQPTIQFWADSISRDLIINDQGRMTLNLDQSVIEKAILDNSFKARIAYQTYYGSARTNGDFKSCDFTTNAPTPAPTGDPTSDPTSDPTKDPTTDPTRNPTKGPTKAPTFQKLSLTTCTAEINSEATDFTVEFTETTFDDEDPLKRYPLKQNIFYVITIGNMKSQDDVTETVPATTSGGTVRYPISDKVNKNQFQVGESNPSTVTIDILNDLGDSANLPITCTLDTQAPTKAPTTKAPTPYPTVVSPIVRFDLTKDNTGKESLWGVDGTCVYPEEPVRRRQMETMRNLLQGNSGKESSPTSAPSAAVLVNDCSFCPVCPITENKDVKYIRLIREPIDFPYDILVRVKMTYLENTAGEGISTEDFDYEAIDNKDYEQLFSSRGNFVPQYILGAKDNPTGELKIPYYLSTEDGNDPDEAFEMSIHSCEIDVTGGAINAVPQALRKTYDEVVTCQKGKYYPAVIVSITQPDEGDSFTSTSEGELPLWVWAPVGFAAVAIPILAYLIYRFYQGKKRADAMENQRKHELGEAAKMDDIGEFGTIGDNVRANPLATGDAFEIPKGDEAIAHQLTMDKMQFEPATVDVEHNIFKQDFGPVQAEKHMEINVDEQEVDANSRENSIAL